MNRIKKTHEVDGNESSNALRIAATSTRAIANHCALSLGHKKMSLPADLLSLAVEHLGNYDACVILLTPLLRRRDENCG